MNHHQFILQCNRKISMRGWKQLDENYIGLNESTAVGSRYVDIIRLFGSIELVCFTEGEEFLVEPWEMKDTHRAAKSDQF